jgi:HK97 family phage portal protein
VKIGPLEITWKQAGGMAVVNDRRGGWYPFVREPYTGAWQRNDEWTLDTVLAAEAVYACVTLIASDIGKLRAKLVQLDAGGIWTENSSAAFSPVLRKPNRYQNRIQFFEWWAMSKLLRGNAYVLKERDARGVVRAMYLLDPNRVTVQVAPDGSVWYELRADNLTGVSDTVTYPASEIIHDRMNCLFHPLVGTTPIYACGSAANISQNIERNSSRFFANGSVVSGQLLVPTPIPQVKSDELRDKWRAKFNPENNTAGQIAVLSGGMKFEPLQMTAVDAQLIEQLKWSAQAVCTAFHVPAFKIGVRDVTYNNAEMANTIYYSDCLQSHIEQMELALDEGLGIGEGTPLTEGKIYGVEFDLSGLIRMDTASQVDTLAAAVTGGLLAPNEARKELGRKPVAGGDTPYLQQQNYSLAALNKRDTQADPFATATPPAPPPPEDDDAADDDEEEKDFDFSAAFQTMQKELVPA